jgi:hypothetical protein
MKSDIGASKAYMRMLVDGTAFSNWENPPSTNSRQMIVDAIMENKFFGSDLNMTKIRKVITESKNDEELKRMMDDMLIKEEEFLV